MDNIIASLDIGTSKVSAVLGKFSSNGLQVLGVGISPNNGMRKGVVVDIDSTTRAIEQAVEQLQNMTNIEINSVYINISGGHASLYQNKGVIAVTREDKEITTDDVKRVMQSARVFAMPPDKQIVDVIPRQFIVDGYDEIRDPVGMFGTRLEVEATIVACSSTTLQNLIRSVERAGLDILGVVVEPFALGEVLLTTDEKDLGVLVVDVGAGKTEYSVFEGGSLKSSSIIPIGGDNITNDIAVGLRIPFAEAEKTKKDYGFARVDYAEQVSSITVKNIGDDNTREIEVDEFAEIVEARVYEIFFLVNRDLVKSGIKARLSAGVVITGGGVSFLRGSKEIAQEVMGLPVRIGSPDYIGVSSPVYSSGVGVIRYIGSRKYYEHDDSEKASRRTGLFAKARGKQSQRGGTFERIKSFIDEYF
ncbi:MAG: Cell division protein FtsA [Firmicutes bacterium]|nr:Cell division protein FtsA [Bacillota bacterium]MDI6706326.1 cell division protein FtsA [Bacillota bacterium]